MDFDAYTVRVAQAKASIADLTRAEVAADAALWAQVPFWAGASDGRSGWSATARQAYEHGVYELTNSGIGVDCGDGRIVVVPRRPAAGRQLASDAAILAIAGHRAFDAAQVLAALRRQATVTVTASDRARVHWRELVAGGLSPTWQCEQRCPDCPDAAFNRTVVALAADWDGTPSGLLEAARGLVADGRPRV